MTLTPGDSLAPVLMVIYDDLFVVGVMKGVVECRHHRHLVTLRKL
jgi:hypothetical protein